MHYALGIYTDQSDRRYCKYTGKRDVKSTNATPDDKPYKRRHMDIRNKQELQHYVIALLTPVPNTIRRR